MSEHDKFDEMANEAVRAYDSLAVTRKRVAALVRREVEAEREACAVLALCAHGAGAYTKPQIVIAAAIRARGSKEGR